MAGAVSRSKRQYVHGLNSEALRIARSLDGVKEARFLDFIEPSSATLADRPPRGEQWVHEVKYDGYRFQCHIHRDVRFYTRRGYDWSGRLRHLVGAFQGLIDHAVIIDGEVVVQTPEGLSDFHALELELKAKDGSDRLVYFVFDCLYLDGLDLRRARLIDRKRVLQKLLASVDGPVRMSDHLQDDGPTIWRRACAMGLEGIVSKRADSRYVAGRNDHWIKTTCRHRDTFAVVGWAEKAKKFDGVYLGREADGKLIYAGKLERGFTEDDKKRIVKRLASLRVRQRPMIASRKTFPKAQWVKPVLLVDAEFRGKTGEGLLRHPAFKGVREDLMQS